MQINQITGTVIDSAMKVHSAFGPGLLESAYKACLVYELRKRGLNVAVEVALPLIYDGIKLDDVGYRLDLLVEHEVVIELKAVEIMAPIFEAQLLHYLKLSGKKVGLLINFKVVHLRDGIKRMVNNL
ncbi:MAG TPA: GxxExxY protein [Blastocatellia bacterium]|nr:GxxExxY protein [Blastocatellia bacterium]